MDNKVIEVLDYLGEKIGLAIDWTADNIYPQVMEFIGRYRIYEIVTDIVVIVISLACCFGFYLYIKKLVIPAKVKCLDTGEDNFWYEYFLENQTDINVGGLILSVFLAILTLGMLIVLLVGIDDLIRWIVIPEAQFYEIIKS